MSDEADVEPTMSTFDLLELMLQVRRLELQVIRSQVALLVVFNALDRRLPPIHPPPPPPPTGPFYPILKSKRKVKKTTSKCAICYDKPCTTKLLPCKHAQFCKTCITRNSMVSHRCPLCRADIRKALVGTIDTTFVPTKETPFLFGPWIP